MNDDLAAIDQHPFARLLAFDADDGGAGGLQRVADVMGERVHLPIRFGGGDDHRVVQAGQLADIENDDVAGFDVFEGGNCSFLNLVKAHPEGADTVDCDQYKPEPRPEANRELQPGRRRRRRVPLEFRSPKSAAVSHSGARSRLPVAGTDVKGRSSGADSIALAARVAPRRARSAHPASPPPPDGRG